MFFLETQEKRTRSNFCTVSKPLIIIYEIDVKEIVGGRDFNVL